MVKNSSKWRSEVAPCPASEALTRHSPYQVMTIWRMNSENPLWRIWKIILRQSAMGWMSLKWVFNGQIFSRSPVWHVGPKRTVLPSSWYQSFVLLHLIACGFFPISSMPDSQMLAIISLKWTPSQPGKAVVLRPVKLVLKWFEKIVAKLGI